MPRDRGAGEEEEETRTSPRFDKRALFLFSYRLINETSNRTVRAHGRHLTTHLEHLSRWVPTTDILHRGPVVI